MNTPMMLSAQPLQVMAQLPTHICLQENKGMTLLVSITFDPDICGLRTGDSHLVTHLKGITIIPKRYINILTEKIIQLIWSTFWL